MRKTKTQILEGIEKETIKSSKIIGNNTLEINYVNGNKAIRLHNTDVITYTKKDTIILNSGGWKTLTTKEIINRYLPSNLRLYQYNHQWFITSNHNYNPINDYKFFDGIELTKDGKIINPIKNNHKKDKKQSNSLKRKIIKYCKLIDNLNKLPLPQESDCWYCYLKCQNGNTLGDETKDKSHLLSHLKENYLHGSIIYNAVKEAGYRYPIFIIESNKNIVKRALNKYLTKRLIANTK